MLRFTRTAVAALCLTALGAGVAVADDAATTTSTNSRSAAATQLGSLAELPRDTAHAKLDRTALQNGLAGAGGAVGPEDVTTIGGVAAETAHARVSMFETSQGAVCVAATRLAFDAPADGSPLAGGCFEELSPAGLRYSVSIAHDGIRVFGAAVDGVDRVEVETRSGKVSSVATSNNAFIWEQSGREDPPVRITAIQGDRRADETIALDHLED
jgi:hypothetical protein